MSKLLSANLMRLRKSKVFMLCMISVFLIGAYGYYQAYDYIKNGILSYTLEQQMFGPTPLISIVIAIFCSLFIGDEFNFGTIRNKLIVGYTKTTIYLSVLLTDLIAGAFFCLSYLAATFVVGMPLLGFFEEDLITIAYYAFCVFGAVGVLTALMVLVVMQCGNKAAAVVIGILVALGLLFVSATIESRLSEPPVIDRYILIDFSGKPMEVEQQPNPLYLEGTPREVCQWIHDTMPTGQCFQISNLGGDYPLRWPFCSLAAFIVITGTGIRLFARKDLN